MNKETTTLGLDSAIVIAALYAFGAFVAWDVHPGHWHTEWRFVTGALACILLVGVWCVPATGEQSDTSETK
jgi:hypothetical protein